MIAVPAAPRAVTVRKALAPAVRVRVLVVVDAVRARLMAPRRRRPKENKDAATVTQKIS
jgi:hypothetical protein